MIRRRLGRAQQVRPEEPLASCVSSCPPCSRPLPPPLLRPGELASMAASLQGVSAAVASLHDAQAGSARQLEAVQSQVRGEGWWGRPRKWPSQHAPPPPPPPPSPRAP